MTNNEIELSLELPTPEPGIETKISNESIEQLLSVEDERGTDTGLSADTTLTERRKSDRRRVSRSHSKSTFYRWLNSGVEYAESGVVGASIFVTIFAVSVALIIFTLSIRATKAEVSQNGIRETERLLGEVVLLRQEYSRSPLQDVITDLSTADSRIFSDYSSLAKWLSEVYLSATNLGIDFKYSFGEVTAMSVQKTVEVPITLSLSAIPNNTNETFSRSLQMLRELVDSRWFIEIVGIVISGDREEVSALDAELRVWVHNDAAAN